MKIIVILIWYCCLVVQSYGSLIFLLDGGSLTGEHRSGDGEANGRSGLAAGGVRTNSPADGYMAVCPKPVFKSLFRSPIPSEQTCSSISPTPSIDKVKYLPTSGGENPPIKKQSADDSVHLKKTADDSVHKLKTADSSVNKHLIADDKQKTADLDLSEDSVTPVDETMSLKLDDTELKLPANESSELSSSRDTSNSQEPYIVHAVPKTKQILKSKVVSETPPTKDVKKDIPPSEEVVQKQQDEKKFLQEDEGINEINVSTEEPGNSVSEEMLEEKKKDDIISFSEWAVKQADSTPPVPETVNRDDSTQSKPRRQNPNKSSSSIKLSKNFASPDCTAKIIHANPESQGGGNVISSSRDEYILNKCSDRAYFVVELCESIKVMRVQLANFELYSSSPMEFRVSIGHTYPGREKDWVQFGTFYYEDERSIQTFKSESGVVGKYAKVEILSHHGTEHYCPVSMFKVFGIPEIDLISGEGEDEGDGDDDDEGPEKVDPQDKGPDPQDKAAAEKGPENPIVSSVKSIVDVLRNVVFKTPQNVSMNMELGENSLSGASMRYELLTGGQVDLPPQRTTMLAYMLSKEYDGVQLYLRTMPLERVLYEYCTCAGFALPPVLLQTQSTETRFAWRWMAFLKVIHGEDFMLLLCNVLSIELGASKLATSSNITVQPLDTGTSTTNHHPTTDFVLVANDTSSLDNNSTNQKKPSGGASPVSGQSEESNGAFIPPMHESEGEGGGNAGNKTLPVSGSSTASGGSNTNGGNDNTKDGQRVDDSNVGTDKDPSGRQGNSGGNGGQATPAPAPTTSTSRETTWQKLANRIRALERNVTLSTGFLEELSLKYIKQIDELNTAAKQMSENIAALGKKEESCRVRGVHLERKVESLTQRLDKFETSLGNTQEELMSRHGLLVILEVCFLGLILFWCTPNSKQINRRPADLTRKLSLDTLKSEKLKEKGKLVLESTPTRRKSIEVGGLCTVGSMVDPFIDPGAVTKKKCRKKRKRKEGSCSSSGKQKRPECSARLNNVLEESDEDVYMTFHGREDMYEPTLQRKRSNSWSENINKSNESLDTISPAVCLQNRFQNAPPQPTPILAGKVALAHQSSGASGGKLYAAAGPYWEKHVTDVLNSTRFLVSKVARSEQERSWIHNNNHLSKNNKRSKDMGGSERRKSQNKPVSMPNIQVSNMYSVLDSSVHELFDEICPDATDIEEEGTATEATNTDTDMPSLSTMQLPGDDSCEESDRSSAIDSAGPGMLSTPGRKIQRSKSTSPSRHTMNMMKKQKVLFKKFKPENADWLQ